MTASPLPQILRDGSDDPSVIKACCAMAYGSEPIAFLLGEHYHPGGAQLTIRLADMMGMLPKQRVVDIASGIGSTALLLSQEHDVEVVGIDLGERQVERARQRAAEAGLTERVSFQNGDAERLPLPDASSDAVICECALCTFPDKSAAAAEMARILRPGGRVGISDIWLEPQQLDPELKSLAARVACIADAMPIEALQATLETSGLTVTSIEQHDDALLTMIDQVKSRLRALRIMNPPALEGFDITAGIDMATRAADVVRSGNAGYVLMVAEKEQA